MKSLFVGMAALCWASGAMAQTSRDGSVPQLEGRAVVCSDVQHESDGSWTALKALPVQRQNEYAEVAIGTNLRRGGPKVAGLDVGGMLDAACPH